MEIISAKDLKEKIKFNKHMINLVAPFLARFLKIDQVNHLYSQVHTLQGLPFIDAILEQLKIKFEVRPQELQNIPAHGAFIVIANHPFGGLDGLLLLKILATARPDFKIMADPVLKKITNIKDYIIPVNPYKMQYAQNIPGMRKALNLLQNDIPIGIFPAGEVASLQAPSHQVIDPEWQPGLGSLLAKARVPVLPIYFSGSNNLIFNLLCLVNPASRTARLPAELLNKEGLQVKIRIDKPAPYTDLANISKKELISFLRAKTYALGAGFLKPDPLRNFVNTLPAAKTIIPETNSILLAAEIAELPAKCFLFAYQQFRVYVAQYKQIPNVMRELGRLRELTFRAAGEGTNQELDLDLFDQHYHHLFVYDIKAGLIVGAYRIGKGKEIYNQYGKAGFYLHTLFKMKKAFTPILKKSLELGRSFVRPEYQKKPLPLYLLWKGIATFLEGKTNYQYLLGPVSISDYFSATSKSLIVNFIQQHFFDQELAPLISPRKKFRYRVSGYYSESALQKNIHSIKSLDNLIADIEPKHMRLPTLLKKYLQQNARIIGFNIDPKFSNSLDGFLIMQISDLPATTQSLLDRVSQLK